MTRSSTINATAVAGPLPGNAWRKTPLSKCCRCRTGLFAGLFAVGLVCLFPMGCAQRNVITTGARITLPALPERIGWKEAGVEAKPGVRLIDPPIVLKPRETCTAPVDGAVLLKPRAWRGIKYGLTEWPRWGETVQSIVRNHNRGSEPSIHRKRPWWRPW